MWNSLIKDHSFVTFFASNALHVVTVSIWTFDAGLKYIYIQYAREYVSKTCSYY